MYMYNTHKNYIHAHVNYAIFLLKRAEPLSVDITGKLLFLERKVHYI